MGEWFTFVCDDCAYEAEVSGGPDAGMLVTVETMSCSDCHSAGSLEAIFKRTIEHSNYCRT